MSNNTKKRIMESALLLFARDGFEGTSIQDIADEVSIVKSALYRHFTSKEEIWNAVLDMMTTYYEENFSSKNKLPSIPKNTDELYEMTMRMVNFTVHDEKVIRMRKIIQTEQFRDERIRKLATRYFIDDTKEIFKEVFASMMKDGAIRKGDTDFMAFSYTAPITALIHLCDREPEKIHETMAKIECFAKEYIHICG